MTGLFAAGDGHTRLDEGDRDGLILSYVATRGELDEAEQRNIATALLRRRIPKVDDLLDDLYLRRLHRAMFGDVWAWAGQYRARETNIGIDPAQIATAVRNLVDDTRTRLDGPSGAADEIAVRFHHRLVEIHPFRNGNGRHGRVAADYLIGALGRRRFTWGADTFTSGPELRAAYRDALHDADGGDITALLTFVRS